MSEKRTGEAIIIESIKTKENGVIVSLSDGDKYYLSVDSFLDFRFSEGQALSSGQKEALVRSSSRSQAFEYALKLLSKESYSSKEIQRKMLAKGFEPNVVKETIARLEEIKMLDDVHYATTYAEDVGDLRLLGKNRIIFDLRTKGISERIIESLPFVKERELDKASRHAAKLNRRYAKVPYRKKVMKINRSLLERGFDGDIAMEAALAQATRIDDTAESAELEKYFALAEAKYRKKYSGRDLYQHIYAYLIRKGFDYEQVKALLEERL